MNDKVLKQFDATVLEADVEAVLVREVRKLGGKAEKFRTPGRRSAPDRICSFPVAYVAFVECKAPRKKPTEKQKADHEKRRAMGFTVLVVDTKEKARQAAARLAAEAKLP